jgi:hypothetical protein
MSAAGCFTVPGRIGGKENGTVPRLCTPIITSSNNMMMRNGFKEQLRIHNSTRAHDMGLI